MRRSRGIAVALFAGGVLLAGAGPAPADEPATVALALDTSGSVGPRDLARARDLALSVLRALPPGSEVAVLAFDDQSRVVVPRTSEPDEVRRRLAALEIAGRYTALYDALYDASRYLKDAPGARKAIVLITDGRDENSALNLDDGLKLAQEARIPVYAIGVGKVDARVLRRIAKLTAGEYQPLSLARGVSIAARIAAQPASSAPRPEGSAPARAAAAGPSTAATPMPLPSDAARPRPWWLLWVLGGAAVVSAVAAFVLRRRAAAGSTLADAAGEAEEGEDEPPEVLSPTVMSRMNVTEEYLEKTVTLREKPVLTVLRGPTAGQSVALSPTSATSIGRAKANDLQIDDVSVSSQHCRVRPEEGRFVLHDLKSTNGTYVNERRVSRQVLKEGDLIKVGESELQFKVDLSRG